MAEITAFGTANGGKPVEAITLRRGNLTARVLTWGAVLQGLWLEGVAYSLTLGSDQLADYEGAMRHHGAIIGPVANRISGAAAEIGGRSCRFDANQDGRICLHSGWAGTHRQVWEVAAADQASVTLAIDLADGVGGFPGNRRITARYALSNDALLLTIQAQTDALTPLNVAHHGYWNLDGSPTWAGHRLRVAADHYLPVTTDFTPDGTVAEISGAMDFRQDRTIAPGDPSLDHNFCLSRARGTLRDVLWLTGRGGLTLTLATTEPGVQVYDGRDAIRPLRGRYEGLALEPQFWPDALSHPDFPSILLAPRQAWQQQTRWRFSR